MVVGGANPGVPAVPMNAWAPEQQVSPAAPAPGAPMQQDNTGIYRRIEAYSDPVLPPQQAGGSHILRPSKASWP